MSLAFRLSVRLGVRGNGPADTLTPARGTLTGEPRYPVPRLLIRGQRDIVSLCCFKPLFAVLCYACSHRNPDRSKKRFGPVTASRSLAFSTTLREKPSVRLCPERKGGPESGRAWVETEHPRSPAGRKKSTSGFPRCHRCVESEEEKQALRLSPVCPDCCCRPGSF